MAKTTIPAGYFAAGSIATADIADNSISIAKLNVSDGSDGQVLTTNGSGTLSFSTVSGTTINNNADNRLITGSGTANTLNGEASATFDSNGVLKIFTAGNNANGGSIMLGPSTDDATKYGSITAQQYDSGTETEGFGIIGSRSTSTSQNEVFIGGDLGEVNAATAVLFYTAANTTTRGGTERMRIDSSGNVGIGSTSPNVALEVHDDVSAGVCLELKNSNVQGYSGVHFRNNSDTLVGHVGYGNPSATNSGLQDVVYFGSITSDDVVFTSADAVRLKLTSAGHLVPAANNTYDLGSATLGFRNIYTNDLNLSNMPPEGVDSLGNEYTREGNDVDGTNGSWTIQEGADDLFIINRTNGKKYRFNLTEVTD